MQITKISIIIPVYNEEKTIGQVIDKILKMKMSKIEKEIIIVNDGSTDKTYKIIKEYNDSRIILINKKVNEGKGSAIRSAMRKISGDVIVIQDADLEYNPNDIQRLIIPIKNNLADVVYGSRFLNKTSNKIFLLHYLGNRLITFLTNFATNLNLSDVETCYKMFTKKIAEEIKIKENRFGFEIEFTIKVALLGARIFEKEINYFGRSHSEGKKMKWYDMFNAIWCILKYSNKNHDK